MESEMICNRCYDNPATHIVTSEIINVEVCDDCAETARELNRRLRPAMSVEPIKVVRAVAK